MKSHLTLILLFFAVSCNLFNVSNSSNQAFREEILSKSIPEQTLYFQSLSPTEQCALMSTKINNTLSSTNITEEEKMILRPLAGLLKPELYQLTDSPLNNSFDSMVQQITSTLKNKYGWSDVKLFKYFETIMTEEEYDEYVLRKNIPKMQP